jgi:ankyrin repeat protein
MHSQKKKPFLLPQQQVMSSPPAPVPTTDLTASSSTASQTDRPAELFHSTVNDPLNANLPGRSMASILKTVLEKKAGVNLATNSMTPLHRAITIYPTLETVATLLESKADPSVSNPETGETAMHMAVKNKECSLEVIKMLIEYKGDPNAQTLNGSTPLSILPKSGRNTAEIPKIAKILFRGIYRRPSSDFTSTSSASITDSAESMSHTPSSFSKT